MSEPIVDFSTAIVDLGTLLTLTTQVQAKLAEGGLDQRELEISTRLAEVREGLNSLINQAQEIETHRIREYQKGVLPNLEKYRREVQSLQQKYL